MFKKLLIIAWVGLVAVSVGCKGDQGDVGPQGAKGDAGAAGPAGPAGPAGEDGEGSGSGAFVFTNGADTSDVDGSFYSGFTFTNAADAEVYENAAVMVYIKAQGVYWPVPGVVSFGGDKVSNYTFVHGVEGTTFFLEIITTGWAEDVETPPVRIAQDIKVIVLPAALEGRINGELKNKSYEEAMSALGLTESNVKTASVRSK
ncbi:hypothetical protein [Dyadobacter sp. CY312]|uniref:hypothetical protein n=1 Tax=Dyadobacter sp. CY312 TaxID=2907303 RepID=UPI001F17121E|nr:hypothetical protein [Dyadobacter sp. CY312]MCE7043381.1 hypothetical protein [Dyadobacter sp. CY312]